MELRHYLDIVKRHRWLVIWAAVTVALIAGFTSAIQTPLYSATAKVLLQPNTDNLYTNSSGFGSLLSDPDRFVTSQIEIASSEDVATAAAKDLGVDPEEVQAALLVSQSGATDILEVTATDTSADHARDIANAVAVAYKDNRRAAAVSALNRAADELQTQLDGLLRQIGELDAKVNDGGLQPGATSTVSGPGAGSPTAPGSSTQAPRSGLTTSGGGATNDEGLKAARYAAAINYEALFNRQLQLKTDASLQQGEAEVYARAETPLAPVSPKPKRNGVLGGFVGLLIGLGVAFLREQLDDKLRSREELERLAGLPVLAELPVDDEVERTPALLIADARPHSPLAEAMRSLRTSIQFLSVDEPIKRIVVTSPQPGDGKSLVAANLATVFAQAGLKTVLVSADLRRPRAEAFFGVPVPSVGLTDVVAGLQPNTEAAFDDDDAATPRTAAATLARKRRAALAAALVQTKVPGLWLLPAGSPAPNPAELLASKRMSELLDDLGRQADIIVLDTPPVLAVTDAAVVAPKTDGVLLVTSLGQTHKHAVERAIANVDASQVLGTVMNRALQSSSYYGYYGNDADAKPSRKDRKRAETKARADAHAAAKAAKEAAKAAKKAPKAPKAATSSKPARTAPESTVEAPANEKVAVTAIAATPVPTMSKAPPAPGWTERRALKREARADERSWTKARKQEQRDMKKAGRGRTTVSATAKAEPSSLDIA